MWNENELTKMLKIDYPIIQAPMAGGITTSALVASVANAGGLGNIGAGYMTPNELRKQIKDIQALTNKPFGVNVFVPNDSSVSPQRIQEANDRLHIFREELKMKQEEPVIADQSQVFNEQIDVIIEEGVKICSFTFGIPDQWVLDQLKQQKVTLIGTATTVKEARMIEASGFDAVVVQGSEAGGHRATFASSFHRGMIGLMALIPQVVDAVSIPVIASGGIMDARGVMASFLLGAKAAQMGTAFLTTVESGAHRCHKEAILHATEDDMVITTAFSGKPARGITNRFIQEMDKQQEWILDYPVQNTLTKGIRKEAAKQNNPSFMSLWAGQNPRLSQAQTVQQFMDHLISTIEALNH